MEVEPQEDNYFDQAHLGSQLGGGGGEASESPYRLRKHIIPTEYYSPSIHNSSSRREMRSPSAPPGFRQYVNPHENILADLLIEQFADAPSDNFISGGDTPMLADGNSSYNEHLGFIHPDDLDAMCVDPSTLSLSNDGSASYTTPPAPPPPHDSQPGSPKRLSESDDQHADDSLPQADAPDDDDVSVQETPSQSPGRISAASQQKLLDCFNQLEAIISNTAHDIGRSPDNILSLWRNIDTKRRHVRNTWNIYQNVYFPKNLQRERARVPGVSEPTGM